MSTCEPPLSYKPVLLSAARHKFDSQSIYDAVIFKSERSLLDPGGQVAVMVIRNGTLPSDNGNVENFRSTFYWSHRMICARLWCKLQANQEHQSEDKAVFLHNIHHWPWSSFLRRIQHAANQ
eukprot:2299178-Amphidinium_carterae.1